MANMQNKYKDLQMEAIKLNALHQSGAQGLEQLIQKLTQEENDLTAKINEERAAMIKLENMQKNANSTDHDLEEMM